MSPEQCRAARGWLDWSQNELAARARVSNSTIRDFEASRRVPIANNLFAIRRAFEDAGIVLLFEDGQAGRGIATRANAATGTPNQSAAVTHAQLEKEDEAQPKEESASLTAISGVKSSRPTFFIDVVRKRG
jgi:transcriptional regulator with XRE-family HTH domain